MPLLAGNGLEVSSILHTESMDTRSADEQARTGASGSGDVTHLRQITARQWRSGVAAWLPR